MQISPILIKLESKIFYENHLFIYLNNILFRKMKRIG